MKRIVSRCARLVFACVCLVCVPAFAQGLRSIGLEVALTWSDTPIWLGIAISTDTDWSTLSASLFITPDGKTLFTGHLDVPLQQESTAFLRLCAGFYYFEPQQPFPYPLVGAGLAYHLIEASPLYVGFAGEFIYPLAFPLPMFSISGGWLP
jgi:hypothetical protein